MIGNSKVMTDLSQLIDHAARTSMSVLVLGETGTGKELVARTVHERSNRSRGPFVEINCAAIPEELFESTVFGHERGAFTGAVSQQIGKFELANGGTLFLDEVAELTLISQAKLLRVLETGRIDRIGSRRPVQVDVRVVAATNADPDTAISRRQFRADLYYRLNGFTLKTPPLRDRLEDIPALVEHFVETGRKETGRSVDGLSPEAEGILKNYHWSGNVRELRNVILQAVARGTTRLIVPEDFPRDAFKPPPRVAKDYREAVREYERSLFADALERARGDCMQVARIVGFPAKNIHRKLRNLKLHPSR